jgi:homocysteine S-methyltransferase
VYANAGHVDGGNWTIEQRVLPHAYAQAAHAWWRCGATIIGGCCGTTPEHIRRLEI